MTVKVCRVTGCGNHTDAGVYCYFHSATPAQVGLLRAEVMSLKSDLSKTHKELRRSWDDSTNLEKRLSAYQGSDEPSSS